MKKGRFSKLIVLVILSMLVLTACDSAGKNQFTIGISQFAEHSALDDARLGFEEGLKELGIDAKIVYQNAQADVATTNTIAEKFVKDKVDLIYAIATPAAQSAKRVTEDIPVLFSAITDPVDAELVESMEAPGGNITGTSDEAPMKEHLSLFKKIDENIETIGIIYNTGEPNSEIQINKAHKLAPNLGLEIFPMGISNINDMPQAMDSLVKKVDAIYTITDNMVASAINIIAEKAIENKMITVGAEDAHVAGGILISDSLSYFELGKQTAHMAKEILIDGKSPAHIPAERAENTKLIFNNETLKSLGLDGNKQVFKEAKKLSN